MRIMDKRTALAAAIVAVACVGIVGGPANADFYKFTFGGEIFVLDGIVPEPWADVHIGSEYEFWYIFDSEAEDHAGPNFIGYYYTLGGELLIDGVSQATREGTIMIWDDWIGRYFAYLHDLPIGAGASIQLSETNVLDSDDLLLDINLEDWNARFLEVIGTGFVMYGHVDSFSGQIVPVPSVTWIVGVVGLLAHGRRRRCFVN